MTTSRFPVAGQVLADRYEVLSEIGRGGYSVVYRTRDRVLDSEVALKLLVPPPAVADQAAERMRREAKAVRGLSHPGIVALYDFVEHGGWRFLVMEYVDGADLGALVSRSGPLPADRVARIGTDVADGLATAHRRGILHRDVKPPNVIVDAEGRARLTDFGSARMEGQASMTATGGVVGTLAYTAPEILAGERGDARSDVYSLGLTLFYGLTGVLPAGGLLGPRALSEGHRPSTCREGIPGWLDDVVARATRENPGARFPTASAMADALRSRGDVAGLTLPPPWSGRCLVCGDALPPGAGVCPACAASPGGASQRLVFLDRPESAADRRRLARELEDLFGDSTGRAELVSVASGHRPLVRLSAPVADRAAEALTADSLPAQALSVPEAARRVPPPFLRLLSVILGVGIAAAWLGTGFIAVSSPVMAGLLWLAGFERTRSPVVTVAPSDSALPPAAEATAVEALSAMPPGAGAELLGTLLRLARLIAGAPGAEQLDEDAETLGLVVSQGADLARGVTRLDSALAVLGDRDGLPQDDAALDAVARAQRARDRLVHGLLEAVASLGRAHGHLAESETRLGATREAARELEARSELYEEAVREVDALLGRGGSRVPSHGAASTADGSAP